MRKVSCVLLASLIAPALSYGASIRLIDGGGNTSATYASPGAVPASITLSFELATASGETILGASSGITASSTGGDVTAYTPPSTQLSWGNQAISPTLYVTEPANLAGAVDFGGNDDTFGSQAIPTVHPSPAIMGILTFTPPAIGVGESYTLALNGTAWFGGDFNTHDFATVEGYTITVPEPATLALMGLGGIALIRRRRRQA